MNNVALITGASSGIGWDFAFVMAQHGHNLVLVARGEDKLLELKGKLEEKYSISITVIAKDLTAANAAGDIFAETNRLGLQVDYLVNNAGFGDFGFFSETDWNKELRMIDLNISVLTYLTKLYLQPMLKRGQGRILNVASTAAFQPGPTMAVYYATKAYVLHFSEAVNNEVKNKGVTVTALCPGPTTSGFQAAASLEDSKLVKGKKLPTAHEVAVYGYASMMKGKSVAIHGLMNYITALSVRFLSRDMITAITRFVQDRA